MYSSSLHIYSEQLIYLKPRQTVTHLKNLWLEPLKHFWSFYQMTSHSVQEAEPLELLTNRAYNPR